MIYQFFNSAYFYQWSLMITVLLKLICNGQSKSSYISEVFGDLNQTLSSKDTWNRNDKNVHLASSPDQQTSIQTSGSGDSHSGALQQDNFMQPFSTQTSRVPLYIYNPGLARQIGLNTLMIGGVLYGLTIIPALLATTGFLGKGLDIFNFFGKRKRRKRSLFGSYVHEMPLLNKESTYKFLSLLETTLDVRRVDSAVCKKYYVCKVYRTALMSGEEPLSLSSFEKAIINTFGIAAERKDYNLKLTQTVKKYFEPAIVGITGSNCTKIYPCLLDPKFNHLSHFWPPFRMK